MRQRLGIAIALLGEPEFLLLDEPINGLDPEGIKEIRDVIVKLNKEKKITFLISSHLLDELSKVVTRYGIIDNGTLIEELDAKDLKEKCKNKLVIEVNDIMKAKTLIAKKFDIKNIVEKVNSLEILSDIEKAAEINTYLVKEGLSVSAIYPNFDSLEEYFMKRIGG
jgi:ABC-2 type transport system ATP-binding protein